eukprot:scaffold148101_cov62-Attheya_sp.AAC.1
MSGCRVRAHRTQGQIIATCAYAVHGHGGGGSQIDTPFSVRVIDFTAWPPYSNACPACTGRYSSYLLPIHRSDVIIWLADMLSKSGTIVCGGLDDMVVKVLWDKVQYRFNIFGKKTHNAVSSHWFYFAIDRFKYFDIDHEADGG